MSSFEELSKWKLEADLQSDTYSIHNALMMRVAGQNQKYHWPLLIDPLGHAETWLRALAESSLKIDTLVLQTGIFISIVIVTLSSGI